MSGWVGDDASAHRQAYITAAADGDRGAAANADNGSVCVDGCAGDDAEAEGETQLQLR